MTVRARIALSACAAAFLALAGACSSNGPPSAPDASIGPGAALGSSCDPSLAPACETLTDVCSVAVCDPTSHRCVRVAVDAGPICGHGGGGPSCGSGECDGAAPLGDAALDSGVDSGVPDGNAAEPSSDAAGDAMGDAALDAPSDAGAAVLGGIK